MEKYPLSMKTAPLFSLPAVTGEQVSLSEILENGNVLLIFLRHLGWIPCREHVAQLCEKQNEFEKLNTKIIIISFGTFPAVTEWLNETCSKFTILIDKERTVYKAYQLEKSFWRSRNLKTRWYYFKAWFQGKKTHDSHGDDTSQLGGDFIIDKNGIIQFSYPSHDPTDRPNLEELLNVLNRFPKS